MILICRLGNYLSTNDFHLPSLDSHLPSGTADEDCGQVVVKSSCSQLVVHTGIPPRTPMPASASGCACACCCVKKHMQHQTPPGMGCTIKPATSVFRALNLQPRGASSNSWPCLQQIQIHASKINPLLLHTPAPRTPRQQPPTTPPAHVVPHVNIIQIGLRV